MIEVIDNEDRNKYYGKFDFMLAINSLGDYRVKIATDPDDEPDDFIKIQKKVFFGWMTIGICREDDDIDDIHAYVLNINRKEFPFLNYTLEQLFKYKRLTVYLE